MEHQGVVAEALITLADDHLILGHRLSEWCGHAPMLEEDLSMPNMALDLLGQARNLYAYAGEIENAGRSEDDIAYLRSDREYRNCLLVERPNGDFAHTMLRQLYFAAFMQPYWQAMTSSTDAALCGFAEKAVKEGTGQVRPVAVLADLQWRKGDKEAAGKRFEQLRKLAGEADIDTPLLAKLAPVAKAAGIEGDWRIPPEKASDLGERPPLDSLGPFRWQPYTAESWGAKNAQGELVASEEFSGRPCILIFYLGFGCLHCVEQLHAFSPMIDQFREAGIEVVGISTETLEQLQLGIKNFDEDVTLSLLSDAENHVFKTFRCWDDFEDQPLHGTFLIDARGQVRWQDISHEPFTDASFVLEESKRLLALP